jgi:hypothetical protein
MSNVASLEKIFNQYAGKKILNPDRLTRDHDPLMAELAEKVYEAGFIFGSAHEKGTPNTGGCMVPPTWVTAEFEKDHKGYRLTGTFKLGNFA